MNNNILRTAKVKTRKQLTDSAEHNFRLREQANIDSSRSHLNQVLVNSLDVDLKKASSLNEKLTSYYKELGVKEKKDNVLMMEFVISASPDFFEGKSKKQIEDWASNQVSFMKNEFKDNVKLAVLHLDEKTPHLHFMVSTEHKTVKKYKNQKGEFHKETVSLCARRFNREFLKVLHDRHAIWNKKFGLKRGVKGSMRKHRSLKEFYSLVDKALSSNYEKSIETTIESLQTSFLTNKVSIEEIREKFAPMLNGLLKQNKVLKEKFKIDIKDWAEDLKIKENELNTQLEDIKGRKELYIEAINEKQHDAALLKEQQTEIKSLKTEVERLRKIEFELYEKIELPKDIKTDLNFYGKKPNSKA